MNMIQNKSGVDVWGEDGPRYATLNKLQAVSLKQNTRIIHKIESR
jgi:hypothetical protein